MNYIENKVYFITGASSGIGKATAITLLESGGKVFDFSKRRKLADEAR
jgi:3-hydroxy acid dehydrogenase/malonic semialdehyde reductase